jgi:putative ABC transport system permease protein
VTVRVWREIVAGLRTLLRAGEADREVAEELEHFRAEAEADLVAHGNSPEEARRAVRLRYGDPLPAREDVRASGWESVVDTLLSDVRLSARGLRRSPGFTVVAVLTLGLGVGATTAIVSAVRPVLLEPLDYPAADRLVFVAERGQGDLPLQTAFGTYRELLERSRSLVGLTVFRPWQPTLTGGEQPVRLEGQSVTASYFEVLGVAPAVGPGFDSAEDRPGGARQVLIAHALWRDRFDADPGVVGSAAELDGAPMTIVGILPAGFQNVTAPRARIWTLLQYDPVPAGFDTREWGRHLEMVGRMRPGVGVGEAAAELRGIAEQPVDELPRPGWAALDGGLTLIPLKQAVIADVKPTMLVLLGAVALLIVVTCANLTILLLARGARRGGEFAMRIALGAGRRRLARYLVTEGLLLAAMGGALGVAVAHAGLSGLIAIAPPSLPRTETVAVDGPALFVALALTTVVGIVFGLAPGLHRAGADWPDVREAGRRGSRRSRASRKALVVAELALTTVLLVAAGLLVRSAWTLFAQPLGMEPEGLVVMQVLGTGLETGDDAAHRFFDAALEAVRQVPGVVAAATTSQLPLSGDADVYGIVPDDPAATEGSVGPASRYAVAPGYLETMGIALAQGRTLDEGDVAGAPRVAVVSRSLARRLSPEGEVLGRSMRIGGMPEPFAVVGVVEDVKHASLASDPVPAVYVTPHQWQWADRVRWIVARALSDPTALLPAMREAVWSADPDQAIVRAQAMDALIARSEARRSFVMILLAAFALSAWAVSCVGLFGVLSGSVTERTHEMGVRAALGASREGIVSLVVRQGMGMAAVGLAMGVGGALVLSDALDAMLFGVERLDAVTYIAVAALLLTGGAAASTLPAIRAGRADPVEALRRE